MRYQALVDSVRHLLRRYGRAEVYWHPSANIPIARIGDSSIRQVRPVPDTCLIGVYTRCDARQAIEDVDAYRAERLGR